MFGSGGRARTRPAGFGYASRDSRSPKKHALERSTRTPSLIHAPRGTRRLEISRLGNPRFWSRLYVFFGRIRIHADGIKILPKSTPKSSKHLPCSDTQGLPGGRDVLGRLEDVLDRLGDVGRHPGAVQGPSWSPAGGLLGPLGGRPWASWAVLGPPWAVLGPFGDRLGVVLGLLWASWLCWVRPGAVVGAFWVEPVVIYEKSASPLWGRPGRERSDFSVPPHTLPPAASKPPVEGECVGPFT